MLVDSSGIVIVGAGECGVRAAFELRNRGFGGEIHLISEELHLPYERPPLSKNTSVSKKLIREASAYDDATVKLHLGKTAVAIDVNAHRISLTDGKEFAYSKLLIATGARPRLFDGIEDALTLRTLDDAERIFSKINSGTRLIVIGGGFIGLEIAAAAIKSGADVTVLEAGERLMARAVPASVSSFIEKRHIAEGVRIVFQACVSVITEEGVCCEGGDFSVEEANRKSGEFYPADLVIAGVGAVPNVDLAQASGLDVENGIIVDEHFRTSEIDVFSAGDCCIFPHRGQALRLESWRAAQEQGAHAAACMLGDKIPYDSIPWFWSDQYDLSLQIAGLMPASGMSITRAIGDDGGFIECLFDEDGALCCAAGVGLGNIVAKDIRLLEMLMAKDINPDPAVLADTTTNLKKLLRAH